MNVSRRHFLRTASSAAALSCTGALRAQGKQEKPAAAGIAATPDHYRQQIDGFGFSEAFGMARGIQSLEEKDRNDLLNLMFSPSGGMGYSILRNIIGEGPANSHPGQNASIEPEPGVFNWTGDDDQVWLMNEAKKRGCGRFMSTSWSPPAWMKTTGKVENGGELKPAMYQQFADYLATYAIEYKKRYGLDIYAISPANEPDFTAEKYASCRWTGGQMKKFLRENLIPTFSSKGVTAQIVIDEHAHWSDESINEILDDSVCAKAIQIVAAHAYAETSSPFMEISKRTGRFNIALGMGKRVWETEVSAGDAQLTNMADGVYWARVIHTHMIEDDVSAWLYWWGTGPGGSRGSLITLDSAAKKYELTKRFFTIGQFARFIRPGYRRVDTQPEPAKNVYFSAYLDPTGKRLVCVAINDDSVEHPLVIQPGGFNATTCTGVRTSNTETHTKLPAITQANGQWVVPTAPLSVTTFILT